MIGRREFVSLFAGVAAWPLAARAQQSAMPAVGILDSTGRAGAKLVAAFRAGLSEGGLIESRNVAIEYRSTEQYAELPAFADELVRHRVTVIAALGGVPAKAAKAATATIPIVFCVGGDPVELGLVASLNRPGGNLTGVTFFAAQLLQKQVGILRDLVPKATLIGILVNPNNPRHQADAGDVQAAARTLGLEVYVAKAGSERDLDAAFGRFMQRNAHALIIAGDAFFFFQREQIVALAARHALPMMYNLRDYVTAGGLMSYGASVAHAYRQAGIYAARLVKGEKPGDLPVMQPTKFDLIINLKAAKALALPIPDKLLSLADEVIE
jgi:putative ABC transport system substrate-binding protein